jgi:hypothetical protein
VPLKGWRWQDNELSILFEPIIGPAASALYCHLTGRAYNDKVTYTLRGLAAETKRSPTTIWRALAVLKHIGMVRIRAGGGSQKSECSLVNLKTLAVSLGASYSRKVASYVLTPSRTEELSGQIAALLNTMQVVNKAGQGSQIASRENLANSISTPLFLQDSKRDAGVSPEIRQRSTRETQTGSHLIQQEIKNEKSPTPTPTPNGSGKAEEDKDSPDEDEPDPLLKWAVAQFTGVIDDLRKRLLDTSRPPTPHLANDAADWEEFGFNSLAVEAAAWHDGTLELTFSASDPETARRGLKKYHRTFDASLRTWYGCEVKIALVKAERRRCCGW